MEWLYAIPTSYKLTPRHRRQWVFGAASNQSPKLASPSGKDFNFFSERGGVDSHIIAATNSRTKLQSVVTNLRKPSRLRMWDAQLIARFYYYAKNRTPAKEAVGVHIALCERTRYFVNVLKKSKTTKKGPPFGEPF